MKRPPQGRVLYDALFADRFEDAVLIKISNGLLALCTNARRLVEEAKLLCEHRHLATAHFLLATASEETAKAYILLDMVRLDFTKRKAELKKLCNAFYSHITKAAYMEIIAYTDGLLNMEHVKDLFQVSRTEFFPGDYESSEPDMYGIALCAREWNLYVDYSNYDRDWMIPAGFIHDDFTRWSLFGKVEVSLDRLEKTRDCGLFSSDCLRILHEEFSKRLVTVSIGNDEIKDLYRRVLFKLECLGIPLPEESHNALLEWPLYSLL